MKNFKFRLQTVLELRERQEKAAQQSFAEADAALRRAEQILTELKDIRAAILEELSVRRTQGFDATETRTYHDYMQTIVSTIKDQEERVRELAASREAFKLSMLTATQDRQVIDKVRTKHKDIHMRESERATQKLMDDLTNTRFIAAQRSQEQTT